MPSPWPSRTALRMLEVSCRVYSSKATALDMSAPRVRTWVSEEVWKLGRPSSGLLLVSRSAWASSAWRSQSLSNSSRRGRLARRLAAHLTSGTSCVEGRRILFFGIHTNIQPCRKETKVMLGQEWKMCIYCIILMTWFNCKCLSFRQLMDIPRS